MRKDKIIYSINIADVQEVAQEVLGRNLTDPELKIVEHRIGDGLDWCGAIESVISQYIEDAQPSADVETVAQPRTIST